MSNHPDDGGLDYKVADLDLADWGRKEIGIAENRDAGPHGDARGIRRHPAARGERGSRAACT